VKQGIRWSSGFDAINQATCSAFGPSSRINGALYWKLYYCSVRPTRGYAYAVVMDVTDKSSASIRFVTYTDELPVTPTVTNPTPSSNTTNKAIVDQLLLNQITNQMLRDGIKHQNQVTWGHDSARAPRTSGRARSAATPTRSTPRRTRATAPAEPRGAPDCERVSQDRLALRSYTE
jgi:hypothetical protein